PSKNLGACGDGGVILTSDEKIAEKVRLLRNHGTRATYIHSHVGFNSRLDAIQAAILRVKLNYLDKWSGMRRQNMELYNILLETIEGIMIPLNRKDTRPSVNYYTIRLVDRFINRDQLREYLRNRGIDTAVYYPLSLHLQEACRGLGYRYGDFPESEMAQEQVLSLPMYPELSRGQIEQVAGEIKHFIQNK
ncbi:MAG: DegT/DnrJ/EryC1/StrS family aminotransferase, partial [Dehalococcoidales bacterium]|nr:DegT/DnrJ/EryC1/StrS family aminotransferase [Dehalococcoidales bacterium]